ncbi:MAG: efflux RND transporter permease subunit [Steroidobacteraceae bacterium]
MRNMSAWAIRNPLVPIVLFVVLTFMGIVAFIRLPINLDPDITFPLVSVVVSQPGAAPSEIETQVTQKIEGAVAGVGNVRRLTSRAIEGQSLTNIEFQIGTPIDRAVSDVRDAVSKVRGELPDGIEEPLVQRINFSGGAIAYYAVASTGMTPEQLSWFVDNTITKRMLALPGVARVDRGGGVDREIRVELDPARLQALGITAFEVNQQIRQTNLDSPGGRAQIAGGEQAIRVLGGARSTAELGEMRIRLSGGRVVRLSDIADVTDGIAEVRSLNRFNGRPATTFGILKGVGASDVTVHGLVEAEVAKVLQEHPEITIHQVFTTVDNTKRSYKAAMSAMIEGAILAVIVVWFFLRDWRSTAISALAIPLSAIPTFLFMQWLGFTLNNISLLALSLVAGVLVDDAIVEIENIVRHMRMGKSGYQAAIDAADEIGLAVVATSATIIAVFVPVSFMSGIVGQYFKQFGLTVAASVFFSLLVARLITPVIAAYTLKPHGDMRGADGPIMERYLAALRWSLAHRGRTVLFGLAFFLVSVGMMVVIPKSVVPAPDFASSQLNIELPPGVRLEDTARISALATAIVSKQPEVTDVIESIGAAEDGQVRNATLYITLVRREERDLTQTQWERRVQPLLREIPDARATFQGFSPGGGGRPVTLYVTGDDPDLVEATALRLVEGMRGLEQLRDARINGDYKRPEIVVRPRIDVAADLGVSVLAISQTVRIATIGDLPQNAPKYSLSDRQIPIRVSLVEATRRDLATIENLPVPTANGGSVPLKAVADISFGLGPTTVRRFNQARRVMVESDLAEGVQLGDAMEAVNALPAATQLPDGVRIVPVGEAELQVEIISAFLLAMGAGILMVFAVLVLLFARVFQPITILAALPLSIGGAMLGLILFGEPFSMPVVIGFLMLMGIVGKNSILLVEFAIEEMRAGRDRVAALMEAGHKRARPIVMTTFAMVAGMLPIAIGLGGSSFNQPMAITVIGGLITSTALTLVIVPAVFTYVDDFERWLAPRFQGLLSHDDGAARAQQQPG